jgi:succinyl-CoA synthetase alpha subunit
MSILIDKNTKLVVQGITGHQGTFHTQQMLSYGTKVVAGVTPGRGGQTVLDGAVPVFDTVKQAAQATGANASVVFVPARFAASAMFEAADAGIPLAVCITEGIPVSDMLKVKSYYAAMGITFVGPNCPGLLTPGESKGGIIPGDITIPGDVGVVSRSGTLTYEVLYALKEVGMGASTCVGMGGDPIHGAGFIEVLELFEQDPDTKRIVLIGEIGGSDEENAARYIAEKVSKPVVGFIAGSTAPPEKRMGHAGAIVQGSVGRAEDKIRALEAVGVRVASHPEEIPALLS